MKSSFAPITAPVPPSDLVELMASMARQVWAAQGVLIEKARFFRVSSSQPSIFVANLTAGLLAADHNDPDVALAKAVGGLIVERTLEGATARQEHGTIDLRLHLLEGGGRSERLIGHATVFGSTLFVYLLASAAKGDLRDAAHPEDQGNAATEVARVVMRTLSTFGQAHDAEFRLRCLFTDETRAARSRSQAAKLVSTIRQHGVLLVLRGAEWDVRKLGDQQVIDQLLGMAAAERDFVVYRTVRGKASLLIANRLPEPLGPTVPFTHEAYRAERTEENGQSTVLVDDHWPVPRASSGTLLTQLVRRILAAADAAEKEEVRLSWDELAVELSTEFGLLSRSPEHQKIAVPLHKLAAPGGALKRMFDEKHRTAWRTGRMPWTWELPIEIENLTDQLETLETLPSGNRRVLAWVECPIPKDLSVTEEEWAALDAVLAKNGRAGRPSSGWERPLRGADEIVGEMQRSLQLKSGGMYRIEERPADQAVDANGNARGWPRSPTRRAAQGVKVLLSVNARRLNQAVGKALGEIAEELEGELAALGVPPAIANPRDNSGRRQLLLAELAACDERIADAEQLMEGAKAERYRAAAEQNEDERASATKDEARYKTRAAEARTERESIERRVQSLATPAPSVEHRAEVALSTLEEVSAALQLDWGPEGTVPHEVVVATRRLVRRSLRLDRGPTVEKANWEITVHVPLRDGRAGTFTRGGTSAGGSTTEAELDRLSNILKAFNDLFGNIKWTDEDRVRKLVTEDLPRKVNEDPAYRNAKKNSDKRNARIEHDNALGRVIVDMITDDSELFRQFMDNESFKKWLADTVFGLTFDGDAGEEAASR